MAYLFSKQDPTEAATRTACSKLSNNSALVVGELGREPAQGLMHVATHVQRSIPALLDTHRELEVAAAQLQAVLAELQDAQEGVVSITGPVTRQDLADLAASVEVSLQRLQQREQHIQRLQGLGEAVEPEEAARVAAGGRDSSGSRRLASLLANVAAVGTGAGAGAGAAAAAAAGGGDDAGSPTAF